MQQVMQRGMRGDRRPEGLRLHPLGMAWDLAERAYRRGADSQEHGQAYHPFIAHCSDFNGHAVLHGGDQRQHAVDREVDVVDVCAWLVELLPSSEGDHCEPGPQGLVVLRWQGHEQTVPTRGQCVWSGTHGTLIYPSADSDQGARGYSASSCTFCASGQPARAAGDWAHDRESGAVRRAQGAVGTRSNVAAPGAMTSATSAAVMVCRGRTKSTHPVAMLARGILQHSAVA